MDRRKFLRATAVASAGLAANPFHFCTPALKNDVVEIGLQVYTLREELKTDVEGTLRKVAELGYNYIELFGYREGKYFDYSVKDMRQLLDALSLKVHSAHIPTGAAEPQLRGTVTNDLERAVADTKEMGQEYLVCPYLMDFERTSLDDYKRLADTFNRAGETCKEYGIQFGYHNHDFEFFDFDGQKPYDVLLAETDPELVKMELDIYWIKRAGYDHLDYFTRFPGRFPLWHVKDMEDSPEKAFAEVGSGVIDWNAAFAAQTTAGMRYFFVEQDVCKRPPLESVAMSYKYLKSIPLR
ncbi:MAG: sugar phosphate isomerase/epimerase [Saprospiraceae bacterium]|nr:sugar phosphate isomerase/epimerase [Saprospiraceae bacterium]